MANDLARRAREAAGVMTGWKKSPDWQTDAVVRIIDDWMERYDLTERDVIRAIREASRDRWRAPDTLLEFEEAIAAAAD